MAKHSLTDILLGYQRDAEYGPRLKTLTLTGNVTKSRSRLVRVLVDAGEALARTMSYTSTRSYGLFLLGFGFLAFVLHFLRSYIDGTALPLFALIAGGVMTLFGVLLTCFDLPLSTALQDFSLTDYVFFEFFCIKRMHRVDPHAADTSDRPADRVVVIRPFVALCLGLLLAALSVILPLWWVLLTVGLLAYLFLTFTSPEFSFFLIFLAMPYLPLIEHSDIILGCAVVVTFLSFVVKVALGKRVYYLERYDVLLGIFLLFFLISGVFVKGVASFGASLVVILFALGYILTSSLVSNRRLAHCAINAVVISAIPVSVIAIVEAAGIISKNGYAGFGGVSATFASPSSLAVYLIVVAVFSLYLAKVRSRTAAKLLYATVFILVFFALLTTAETWAFIAGFFGVIAYGAASVRRVGSIIAGVVSLLPYALLAFGERTLSLLDKIPVFDAVGFTELAARWSASFRMLADNLFVGVGVGGDSFLEELGKYSDLTYTDSGNFLLEIGCEAGILALAVFILMILLRLVHRTVYRRYTVGSEVHHLTDFSAVTLTVLLVYGAVNYLWSDFTLNYLFWCVFGIGSAALRVAKREFDDRAAYFSDGRSSDASSVDVLIF